MCVEVPVGDDGVDLILTSKGARWLQPQRRQSRSSQRTRLRVANLSVRDKVVASKRAHGVIVDSETPALC